MSQLPQSLRRSQRANIFSFLTIEQLLFGFIAVGAFLVILRSAPLIASPYQIDYGEGLILDGALRVLHAQPLYPNPFTFPVVLHVYGPVSYVATASVLPGGAASFPAGRLLILICSLAISSLIATILRRLTGSWWIGLSFGFVLLTLPAFRFWLYLLRADLIGVVLSTLAIAIYLFNEKRWYWSIPFFVLALFCKYSLIAGAVAVFVHLILKHQFKRGAAFGLGLGVAASLAFMVLEVNTGKWFAFHMFSTHPDRYSLFQFFSLGALVWASAPVITALAGWFVAMSVREGVHSFAPIYLAASTLTSLTGGKLGSTTNHFIEWMVACCICAGLGYSLLQIKYSAKSLSITVLIGVSVLAGVIAQNRRSLQPSGDLAGCGDAYHFISASSSSRILSESLGPLLLPGKPIVVSDPFVYGQLIGHSLWPDRRVEDLLNERYFGLIVMSYDPRTDTRHSDVWPEPLLTAIARNYRTTNRFTCRYAGVMLEPALPPTD
jgi:hypothetical protein